MTQNNEVLALKYRPKTLDEIIGNEDTVQLLKSQLAPDAKQPLSRAVLLHGPTGCGKTTLARIIAQELGASGRDLQEIDSADFRGIDTIREIRRQCTYKPLESPCRVWILDECFAKGTKVRMLDGTEKCIEEIRIGERVRNLRGGGLHGGGTVTYVFQNLVSLNRVVRVNFENGNKVICSREHWFLTSEGWRAAETLTQNSLILTPKQEEGEETNFVRVESVETYQQGDNDESFSGVIGDRERDQGFVTFYDLEVDTHPSYVANGVLVHNCHRLTSDSQSALLKALEDTPSHVYFILCTTDPQKLLPTIRGRCASYQVNPLTDKEMKKLLLRVVKAEGDQLDREVYNQIVQDSMGYPRNALQILSQVLAVDEDRRLTVARRTAEKQSQIIELCRALVGNYSWQKIASILKGLKQEDPEQIRRAVLGYCQSVLLNGENDQAAAVMQEFLEPTYQTGFPGITFACYSVICGEE